MHRCKTCGTCVQPEHRVTVSGGYQCERCFQRREAPSWSGRAILAAVVIVPLVAHWLIVVSA